MWINISNENKDGALLTIVVVFEAEKSVMVVVILHGHYRGLPEGVSGAQSDEYFIHYGLAQIE